jgi:Tol biopolymer transport system component
VTPAGQQANGESGLGEDIQVSADGRYVAFMSRAANMNPGDTGIQQRVYRYDRLSGTTQLASIAIDGTPMQVITFGMSGDGNLIVFHGSQVYVRNMALGQTEQASITHDEQLPNLSSGGASISSDGRYVMFHTRATMVPAPPVNGIIQHVYVRDRVAGTTILVSQNTDEEVAANDGSSVFRMRGHQAMFFSNASNLLPQDPSPGNSLYVRNLDTGVLELLTESTGNIDDSDLSDDGRFYLFNRSGGEGVQLRDRVNGTTTRVDRAFSGGTPNGGAFFTRVSNDGRFVSFISTATNLLAPGIPHPGTQQCYVRDMVLSQTALISVDYDGNYCDGSVSSDPGVAISSQFAVFKSNGSHVVLGDTNGVGDVFLRQFTFDCDTPRVTAHPTAPAVCTNQPVTLTVSAAGPGLQYQWSHDGVDIPGATSATYSIPNATAGDVGFYTVRVYNTCGTVFSDTVQFLVLTDMNGTGVIDIADLAELLSNFGRTGGVTYADGDLNGDGTVSLPDLTALLSIFGQPCS